MNSRCSLHYNVWLLRLTFWYLYVLYLMYAEVSEHVASVIRGVLKTCLLSIQSILVDSYRRDIGFRILTK